jgi:dynein heavy chain 2
VLDLWKTLTDALGGVRPRDRDGRVAQDSVSDFIWMENDMASDMCAAVDGAMKELRKVLSGSGLLTPAIQSVSLALLADSVPAEWTHKWDSGPEKPQSWLRELIRRRQALGKWKSAALKGTLLDDPLTLCDLFNPATFVNALRQQTARKLGEAIDRVKLVSSWDKDPKRLRKACPMPCLLSGLLLQGASFATNMLRDAASDASELSPAPPVTIGFVRTDEDLEDADDLSVPLYLTPARENLLLQLKMPASADQHSRWVLAGIALCLSEDD